MYVQSDARMSVASSMFDFEQFSNSSFLDIMDIYIYWNCFYANYIVTIIVSLIALFIIYAFKLVLLN